MLSSFLVIRKLKYFNLVSSSISTSSIYPICPITSDITLGCAGRSLCKDHLLPLLSTQQHNWCKEMPFQSQLLLDPTYAVCGSVIQETFHILSHGADVNTLLSWDPGNYKWRTWPEQFQQTMAVSQNLHIFSSMQLDHCLNIVKMADMGDGLLQS